MFHRFEHSRVFRPGREMKSTGAELGRPVEDVYFKADDGAELNGWFFPADPASPRARLVVLLCHGNAGNISTRLEFYRILLESGVNVFTFDYRGYGRSQGRLSEEGTYLDAQAAHRWLRQKGFDAGNLIAYGESLGGGVASELCVRERTGGLILQSTFTSMPDLGVELYPWLPVRWLSRIRFDTRGRLGRLKIPVLVMHSRADALIGFHHGEKLFAAAGEPKLFCEVHGEHADPLEDRARFRQGIEEFLRLIEATRARTPAATSAG